MFYFAGAGLSKELIKVFKDIFTTFGVPQEITTDGGPQFSSHDLVLFLEKWGVHHKKSAPYNPHANLSKISKTHTYFEYKIRWIT